MKYLNKLYKVNHMMIKIIVAGFQELWCLNNPSDKVTFQDVEEKRILKILEKPSCLNILF